MKPRQIFLKELAEDSEHLREELGKFLRMKSSPEMAGYQEQLTDIIHQIMTLLNQEREALNSEK
jgi:ribosome-binding factor A